MSLLLRVSLVIAAALLPPLAMQAYNESALRHARQADVRDQALRQAREIAADLDRILDGARDALVATAEFPAIAQGDGSGCARLLVSINARLPFLQSINLIDDNGLPLCDSHGGISGRSRAQDASVRLARRRGGFAVAGTLAGEAGDRGGLSVAWPLNGSALPGTALVADLDLDWLRDQFDMASLPPGSSMTIADREGRVLLRLPDRRLIGTRLAPEYLWMVSAAQPGVTEGIGSDGARRIVGFLPAGAGGRDLFVSVGFSTANAYAASEAAALRGYALIAAGALAAMALAMVLTRGIITRPVGAILRTTERWSGGDTAARVPVSQAGSELGRIALAVNGLLDTVVAAQTRLAARLTELDAVYDAAPVGLGFVDHDLKLLTSNARLGEIAGVAPGTWRGLGFEALLPDVARQVLPGLRGALAGERMAPVEVAGAAPADDDGVGASRGGRRLLIGCHPAIDAGGQVLGAVLAVQDITRLRAAEAALQDALYRANAELERRVAERTRELDAEVRERETAQAQLQQAQKMELIGQLTGGVAHDFNNLLTAVIGNIELTTMRSRDRPDLQRLLTGALRAAERGAALTQRMLAFGRRQYLRVQPVALPDLLDGMTDLLARSIGPQVEIRRDLPPDVWPVRADPNQVELVVLNLLVNARDAMPDGGVATIGAAPDRVGAQPHPAGLHPGDYVRLWVRDTGIGMDAETRARAFEPFFTTKPVGKGSGLGLSMVQGVSVQSGGGVAIDSAPGRGAVISVWFPRAESVPLAPAHRPDPDPPIQRAVGGHLLLADDDPDVLAFAAASLQAAGYRVDAVSGGEEALARLRQTRPTLLVTDLGMPGMSGLQLAAQARMLWPDLPVLIATGYADHDVAPSCGATSPDLNWPVLNKPFKIHDLLARVAELVGPSAEAGSPPR